MPINDVLTQSHQPKNQNPKNNNRGNEKTSQKSRMSDLLGDLFDF